MVWPRKKIHSVGIDVGTRALKGVWLSRKGQNLALNGYFFHDLSRTVKDYPMNIDAASDLKALIDTKGLTGWRVACNLKHRETVTYDLSLPPMPEADQKAAVRHDLEEHISYPVEEAKFGLLTSPTLNADPTAPNQLKVYCASKTQIGQRTSTFEFAGLKPYFLEPEVLSLTAMLDFNGYLSEGKYNVAVDLGEDQMSLILLHGDKIKNYTCLPIGMGQFNKALLDEWDTPYLKAEEIKYLNPPNVPPAERTDISDAIQDIYADIFFRMQRVLKLYKVQLKGESFENLLLTGGGCLQPGLPKALGEQLDTPCEVVNPLRKIELYQNSEHDERLAALAPQFGSAVGLALEGVIHGG